MRTQQPTSPPPPSTSGRRPLLLALVLTLLLIGGASAFLATRGSDNASSQAAPPPPVSPTTSPPTTSLDERAEVIARLHEILRIRDEAYRVRNVKLLENIYTSDCPCLKSDRDLINYMREKHILWTTSKSDIQVKEVERANNQLWIVTAVLEAAPFQVENESGQIIRTVPKQSDLSHYVLAKPEGADRYLLGKVSFIRRVE
jgi:hypothetical protein